MDGLAIRILETIQSSDAARVLRKYYAGRHQIELDFPRGKRLGPGYEQRWRAETNEVFGRVRTVLAQ